MSLLSYAFSVLSGDTELFASLFCVLVIVLCFGSGLEGMVDGTSLVRGSGEMCSAESLFWDTLFDSEKIVLLGVVIGLSSMTSAAVTPVVVVSVVEVVIVVVAVKVQKQ